MPSVRRQVGNSLTSLISATHETPPDYLWDVGVDAFGVMTGHFSADGEVYAFKLKDDSGITLTPTDRYDAYVAGLSAGLTQNASTLRTDRRQVQCGSNTKRCGGRCIPKEQTCHIGLSAPQQQQAQETRKTIREAQRTGNWQKVALIGGAIAGLAAVGIGAAVLSQRRATTPSTTTPTSPISLPSSPSPPSPPSSPSSLSPSSLSPSPSLLPPSPFPLSPPPAQTPAIADLVRQSILTSTPMSDVVERQRLARTVASEEAETVSPDLPRSLGGMEAAGALPAATPRLTNQTPAIANPLLVTPPSQGVVIAGAGSPLPPKPARAPRKRSAVSGQQSAISEPEAEGRRQKVEGRRQKAEGRRQKVEGSNQESGVGSQESGVSPKPKTQNSKLKTPPKPEVEQQTDRLLRKHGPFATRANAIAASKGNPAAVTDLADKVDALDVAHRQLLNPLQPNYFEQAPIAIRATTTQLRQAARAAESLEKKLLAGKTLETRQQEASKALTNLDEHLQRLEASHAFVSSQPTGVVRDRQLEGLNQQRAQVQSLRENVATTAQTLTSLTDQKTRLALLQARLALLPTRQNQLEPTTLLRHKQVEKIRQLQGTLPTKVAEFVQEQTEQAKAIGAEQVKLNQTATEYQRDRQFAHQSMEVFVERQKNQLDREMQTLRLMSGEAGLKWVTGMANGEPPQGMELTVRQAKEATGVRTIETVEQAALFRHHVQQQLAGRIEGMAQLIEKRMRYPHEVSERWLEQANAQMADLTEMQKQVVVGGQVKSKKLIKDLQKTARETAVELQGNALLQPHREAHEAVAQQIQAIQTEQAQAVGSLLVDGQSMRDRIMQDLSQPLMYELNGKVQSAEQLQAELNAMREESRTLRTVQQITIEATPTAETKAVQAVRQKQANQSQAARSAIGALQKQIGQIQIEITRRQAAAERGQTKGIQTGALEAKQAALQKQMNRLARQFFGTEKRDAVAA